MRFTIPITPYTIEKLARLFHDNSETSAFVIAVFLVICVGVISLAMWRSKK